MNGSARAIRDAASSSRPETRGSAGKHTPAPWSYEVHELSSGYSAIVYGANGMRIGTDHLSEADARLIAAAPDLYAALCRLCNELEMPGERGVLHGLPAALEAARAALSLAGEG